MPRRHGPYPELQAGVEAQFQARSRAFTRSFSSEYRPRVYAGLSGGTSSVGLKPRSRGLIQAA
jgi:hypothetical protein